MDREKRRSSDLRIGNKRSRPESGRGSGRRGGESKWHPPRLGSYLRRTTLTGSGEPTVDLVREGVRQARDAACDVVISIGGGSAIDAGKTIAIIATNGGEPLEFLEAVGKGRTTTVPPLPFIEVPTTAGTGSEVTRNAVMGSTEYGVKASLRSPPMLPRVGLSDTICNHTFRGTGVTVFLQNGGFLEAAQGTRTIPIPVPQSFMIGEWIWQR